MLHLEVLKLQDSVGPAPHHGTHKLRHHTATHGDSNLSLQQPEHTHTDSKLLRRIIDCTVMSAAISRSIRWFASTTTNSTWQVG